MMQKANVGHEGTKWTKWREGESYPAFVDHGRCIEGDSFVVSCQCRWKKKSDEKAKKKQRIRIDGKMDSCRRGGVLILGAVNR
jgi:hypothetical protein